MSESSLRPVFKVASWCSYGVVWADAFCRVKISSLCGTSYYLKWWWKADVLRVLDQDPSCEGNIQLPFVSELVDVGQLECGPTYDALGWHWHAFVIANSVGTVEWSFGWGMDALNYPFKTGWSILLYGPRGDSLYWSWKLSFVNWGDAHLLQLALFFPGINCCPPKIPERHRKGTLWTYGSSTQRFLIYFGW